MTAIDTLFFGLVAGLVGFKVALLAAAALLSLSLASHANQAIDANANAPAAAADNANLFDPNYWMAAFTPPRSKARLKMLEKN